MPDVAHAAKGIFEACNAIEVGHFVGTAMEKAHLGTYIAKMRVFRNPAMLRGISECLVDLMRDDIGRIDVLIARPTAGLFLLTAVGLTIQERWPQKQFNVVYAATDRNGVCRIPSDERQLVRGANCAALDDIIDTGHSSRALVAAIEAANGNVIGMYACCNRGNVLAGTDPETQIPVRVLRTCFTLPLTTYRAELCPLCKQGVPIRTDLGHGAEWLERQKQDHHIMI